MKKILGLFFVSVLASCTLYDAVRYSSSYTVEKYDTSPYLISEEYIEERAQPKNEVLTSYVGTTVADKKIYRKKTYSAESLRANSNVTLSGASFPVKFKRGEKKEVMGQIYMEDGAYFVIPTEFDKYVALINQKGELYNRIGQVRNRRLILANDKYFVSPSSFKFETVTSTSSKQSRPEKGFDIKYGGINLDRLVFTYLDYSKLDEDRGIFEDISFPLSQEYIEIEGIGFKVLKATPEKIDYIILK